MLVRKIRNSLFIVLYSTLSIFKPLTLFWVSKPFNPISLENVLVVRIKKITYIVPIFLFLHHPLYKKRYKTTAPTDVAFENAQQLKFFPPLVCTQHFSWNDSKPAFSKPWLSP